MKVRTIEWNGLSALWTDEEFDAVRELPASEQVFVHELKARLGARLVFDTQQRERRSQPFGDGSDVHVAHADPFARSDGWRTADDGDQLALGSDDRVRQIGPDEPWPSEMF